MSMEDLIPETNTVITMTKVGYIKRMSTDNFKAQHRGGKGIKGMETIEDDYIVEMLMTTSHHYLMFSQIQEEYTESRHMRYLRQAVHQEAQPSSILYRFSLMRK